MGKDDEKPKPKPKARKQVKPGPPPQEPPPSLEDPIVPSLGKPFSETTLYERAALQAEIVSAFARGISLRMMTFQFGVTRTFVDNAIADYKRDEVKSTMLIKQADRVESVDTVYRGLAADLEDAVIVGSNAVRPSDKISAINTRVTIRGKQLDLLQKVGVLPSELAQLTVEVDVQALFDGIYRVFKQHNVAPELMQELRVVFGHIPHDDDDVIEGVVTEET